MSITERITGVQGCDGSDSRQGQWAGFGSLPAQSLLGAVLEPSYHDVAVWGSGWAGQSSQQGVRDTVGEKRGFTFTDAHREASMLAAVFFFLFY